MTIKIYAAAAAAALLLPAAALANSHMEPGKLPKCSATVTDSCDQGANNPKAMTAAQAEASGGVGDRVAVKPMPAKKKVVRRKTVVTTTATTTTSQ